MSLPYWTAAREGRLVVQRCTSCGKAQFPPDLLCRYCQQPDPSFVEIDGRGTIYTFAIYTRSFSPAFEVPYALALVTLDACPDVAVVCLTASANKREIEALYEAGAVACLTKDQELEEIVAAIHRAAGRLARADRS